MPEIRFLCIKCKSKIAAPEVMKGQHFNCPNCGQPMSVPQQSEPGFENQSSNSSKGSSMSSEDDQHITRISYSPDKVDSDLSNLSHLKKTVKDPLGISDSPGDRPLPASEATVKDPLLIREKEKQNDFSEQTIKMDEKEAGDRQEYKKINFESIVLSAGVFLFIVTISGIIFWIVISHKKPNKEDEQEITKEIKKIRYSDVFKPAVKKKNPFLISSTEKRVQEEDARKIWFKIKKFMDTAPLANEEKISELCKKMQNTYPSSPYTLKAQAALKILNYKKSEQRKRQIIENLKKKADNLMAKGKPEDAANLFLNYSGILMKETLKERQSLAKIYLAKSRIPSKKPASLSPIPEDLLVRELIKGKFDVLEKKIKNSYPGTNPRILALISELAHQDELILKNIKNAIGKTYLFSIKGKRRQYKIAKVENKKIYLEYDLKNFKLIEKITPKKLSFQDRVAWSHGLSFPALAILRGIVKLKNKKFVDAEKFFGKAGILAQVLRKYTEQMQKKHMEERAEKAFVKLFRKINIKVPKNKLPSPEQVFNSVSKKEYPEKKLRLLLKDIASYKEKFGNTQYAVRAGDLLSAASEALTENLQKQRERIIKRKEKSPSNKTKKFKIHSVMDLQTALVSVNPDYNGNGKIETEKKKIIGVILRKCKIVDISPLAGLPIEFLDVSENKNLTDFTPLISCKKLKSLNASGTGLKDISFLTDKPLVFLNIKNTLVSDISPLKGKRTLKELIIANNKAIKDISPLKGSKLVSLDAGGTSISDISSLRSAPLTKLNISWTNVTDLTILKGKKQLRKLFFNGCKVKSLKPLRTLKLTHIGFSPKYYDKKSLLFLNKMESLNILYIRGQKLSREKFWIFFNGGKYRK